MENLVYCVIPNWNGKALIGACLDSLLAQTIPVKIVVVENGSTDGSPAYLKKNYPQVTLIEHDTNYGFAGGVNAGIKHSLTEGATFIALFNNDAHADKNWLKSLVQAAKSHPEAGIVTGKLIEPDKDLFDSTGEIYTSWGLPYPRGRGYPVSDTYDKDNWVFGATGGASLYRSEMLRKIGLFDEDFFAYYEDVDISFRAQLAGWKVYYQPSALAYHQIGATSGKIKGFTTYQTFKNLPMILWKNLPYSLWPTVWPRLFFAYWSFMFSAFARGQGWPASKGHLMALYLLPKKFMERRIIQKNKTVSDNYIRSIFTWDLPPNAFKLRNLRAKLKRKS